MSERPLKIIIIGNSVAIRVRPPEKYPENLNYTQVLERYLHDIIQDRPVQVINMANGGDTVNDIIGHIDHYVRTFPDFFIINAGVVDASNRDIPRWFFNIINNKREGFFRNIARTFYNGLIKKFRSFCVVIRGKRSWVSKGRFEKVYTNLIINLLKETNARIITMAINPGNERVEKQVPGTLKKYAGYTGIIKNVSAKYGARFISLDELQSPEHYPDGIHFSKKGHEMVARRLAELIANELKREEQN